MKKVVIAVLVLALLGGGGYGAYYYFYLRGQSGSVDRVSSTSEDAVHVDSVAMIAGIGSGDGLTERFGGETVAQATLEVKLDSERKVKECFVKKGDEVKEGDVLFVYDTQEDEDKLAQAEIDIERSEGEIETSRRTIEENERMRNQADAEDQLTYTTTILQEENSIKQKEYDIKTKQREIEQLKEAIDNAEVTAEMAGIIQNVNDSGESASASYGYDSDGGSAYITILAAGDFRIEGKMNEQNMGSIMEGMPMIVFSRVDEDMKWYGVVSEIDTSAPEEDNQNEYAYYGNTGADSSTYKFYVELDSSEGLILGQHVYMEADVGQEDVKEGLWLEDYYIMDDNGDTWVWCASDSNVLEKRKVTLGEYDEEQMKYEITDGLDEDDYIAFPMDDYKEGQPVVYNSTDTGIPDMGGLPYGEDMENFDGGMYDGDMEDFDDFSDAGEYFEEGAGGDMDFYDADADDGMDYYDADADGEDMDYYDADADGEDMDYYDADADDGSLGMESVEEE